MKKHIRKFLCAMNDIYGKNDYSLEHYPAKGEEPAPFALICPGGGYSFVMSCIEGQPYADALNELGYHAFVLRYHRGKKARYPAPMEDVARAVSYILENAETLKIQKEGYSLWGSSAGGHLAASFGTSAMGYGRYGLPKPGAIVLAYPVITMGDLTHAGSRENLLGKNADQKMIELTSIERQITADYPPTFVWCGTADKTVDPSNSKMLAKALQENGVPFQFEQYSDVDHGVGLGKGLACEPWLHEAIAFWERHKA